MEKSNNKQLMDTLMRLVSKATTLRECGDTTDFNLNTYITEGGYDYHYYSGTFSYGDLSVEIADGKLDEAIVKAMEEAMANKGEELAAALLDKVEDATRKYATLCDCYLCTKKTSE